MGTNMMAPLTTRIVPQLHYLCHHRYLARLARLTIFVTGFKDMSSIRIPKYSRLPKSSSMVAFNNNTV